MVDFGIKKQPQEKYAFELYIFFRNLQYLKNKRIKENQMKKIISLNLLLILTLFAGAQNIEAFFSYVPFNSPNGPYIETSITAIGKTFVFNKNANGKMQASMGVTITFTKEDKIVKFDKYDLLSPEINEGDTIFPNFIDFQRISIENGVYQLEVSISDNYGKNAPVKASEMVAINFTNDLQFSGIQLIESYKATEKENILTKIGYDMIPYNSDFMPDNMERLIFYSELYNSDKGDSLDMVLIRYYIENAQTNTPMQDYNKFLKRKVTPVIVVFGEFSLLKLPSGNYNLVTEVRNKNNKLLSFNKKFFYRSNPAAKLNLADINTLEIENTFAFEINNSDSMKQYVDYLFPISDINERMFAENLIKKDSLVYMQKFFYNFWYKRNMLDPKSEWEKYHKEVKKVNSAYNCLNIKGYKSEQGRVYLQYGPPNEIIHEKEGINGKTVEFWHYFQVKNQNNIKFVFYDNMGLGCNLRLLHSDMVGEIQNYNWMTGMEDDTMNPYVKDGTKKYDSKLQNWYDQ
ncbi:MAG: hypothetical protein A2W91_16290 [Bacteroidetes bacterium GWF2_38_335]|nr:MAG: hypothetical protein A2W91_16290 [Bacteroidetes bacterium GWF2_38_335]OFY81249.1 MAG: hypothetical protein A2281_07265 [Bacteroidetes bacterium RIFOXYA12_FULL_38_20]HBS85366.1 hypothetical protein [Bacteroidales bacterium]